MLGGRNLHLILKCKQLFFSGLDSSQHHFSHQAFGNLLTDGINVQMDLDDMLNNETSMFDVETGLLLNLFIFLVTQMLFNTLTARGIYIYALRSYPSDTTDVKMRLSHHCVLRNLSAGCKNSLVVNVLTVGELWKKSIGQNTTLADCLFTIMTSFS